MATIFWVVQMSAGSTMVVEYPAGAVNTMYNEITFSSMIYLDPDIVPKRKNSKVIGR